ncbi:hypothetical protein N9Q99_01795 [Flavobacteriales bacterium]|nr:hypothetical protein [Flavobacteriales bacterium]
MKFQKILLPPFYIRGLGYYIDNYPFAIVDFNKAIALDSTQLDYYYFLGESYYFSEKYDLAKDALVKVIEL